MGRLEGQAAVVTGGASGIGEGIVLRFAAEGAHVVVADIDTDAGARVAQKAGGLFVQCDVSRQTDLANAVDTAVERYGRLDCFVGNAGIGCVRGAITDLDQAGFDRAVAVLLGGVAFGMKHACRAMQAGGHGGSIISTSSVAGVTGGMGPHIYSACKAGVIGLTRSVALEQGPLGIRVNCIVPGGVATSIFSRSLDVEGQEAVDVLQLVSDSVSAAAPLGRIGQPTDIAGAALWLASEDSSYVTGQAIVVDGGLTAVRGTPLGATVPAATGSEAVAVPPVEAP